ncbi:MAG: VanZ family protein [Cycloclasticus sp.]|nr:VanZ family protein [Cycloclasticus sp.]
MSGCNNILTPRLKTRLAKRWVRASLLLIVLILVLSLFIVGAQSIAVGLFPTPIDKFVHAVFFGVLTFLLWCSLGMRREVLVLIIASSIAVLDEWHQRYLPGRSPDLMDLGVDVLAILLVLIFLEAFKKKLK